ncbi:uncharacterized protein LOC111016544 [Momordica charantia]|uniref:Uncharacterized protein LOC111016544 n=1 Tax=Momordica charantia TaxID=3673 RepID=A0A6J1D315_MOMCH|nr:uncharacterized protein LOC111016544 [Momordica charantia]
MTDPRAPLPSSSSPPPPLPPNDLLPRRFKVIWRVLLISNFALAAYMFANARKKDLGRMEKDPVEKHSDGEVMTNIPSTLMVDTTAIAAENISEDHQREPFQWMFGKKR